MVVSLTLQWGVILPLVALLTLAMGWGLLGAWCVQTGVRLLQAGVFARMWHNERWQGIRV
jgi:Na+-driven multidrug efflux pump